MSSLLRKFESRIEHDFISPLFTPDADAFRREAEAVAKERLASEAPDTASGRKFLAAYGLRFLTSGVSRRW